MVKPRGRKNPLKAMALTQHKILPQLERLIQLLEDGKLSSPFISAQSQQSAGITHSFISSKWKLACPCFL